MLKFQAGKDDPQVSVISGWDQYPAHPVGWQGLLYYEHPVLPEKEAEGTYIYPDWTSCVQVKLENILIKPPQSRTFNLQGTWIDYILEKGQYCTITEVDI